MNTPIWLERCLLVFATRIVSWAGRRRHARDAVLRALMEHVPSAQDVLLRYFETVYAGTINRPAPVEFEEAVVWFASDSTANPYSFVNICAELSLDAQLIRRMLEVMEEVQREGQKAA